MAKIGSRKEREVKVKKEKQLKNLTLIQLALLTFLAVVLLTPFVQNRQFTARIREEISSFRQEDRTEQVSDMLKMNEEIDERGNFYTADPFHSEVRFKDRANMLGVLEIPKINEELSVYDRTDSLSLSEGVGLLEGTHMPTGGIGNTTVLTGHDGMAEATIFKNLDRLEEGDTFTFDNGVEVLTYEVYEMVVVLPHETEYIEQIDGQDTMILLTCETPDLTKGINTHRLLVYGRRIPTVRVSDDGYSASTETEKPVVNNNLRYTVFGAIGAIILLFVVVKVIVLIKGKRNA